MPKNATAWLSKPQTKLRTPGLVALLLLTSLVTPLSLDMYLPAVPQMTQYFDVSEVVVNFTLAGYFLFFSVGLLIFGPLSDRYGRRKVLIAGAVAYTLASMACALSPNIMMLIAMRIVQALGAGAAAAVSTAVIKDAISPAKREAALSVMQVLFVIGPVLAPVIGAFVLQIADWRMTFWVLTIAGLLCTVLSLLYEETLPREERFVGTLRSNMAQLGVVAQNKGFTILLMISTLFSLPYMAYIAVSSYIYVSFFGLSEMEFSYFFAALAGVSALGPFIWLFASKFLSVRRFTTILLSCALVAGISMLATGGLSPFLFFATFLLFSIAQACMRPYVTNILLSQRDDDAGAASSLINFAGTAFGFVGMVIVVLPWPNYIVGIGIIIVATALASSVIWLVFLKSSIPLKGLKDVDPNKPAAYYREQLTNERSEQST